MYNLNDLFNQRSIFAAKLEQLMEAKSITKSKLCKEAGISRPTLDKLLAVEITNETNFEKHVNKILNFFQITPDLLMGNTHNNYNRVRQLECALHLSNKAISTATGISLSRLKEIESGTESTTAELRDIALCCKTSVRGLLGTNYFDIPFSQINCITKEESFIGSHGFWGHIGILPNSKDEYLWFPISSDVHNYIYDMLHQQLMVIPCMNNKVLLLNMDGINNIVLLDNACNQPDFANWDSTVSEGETPLVIYEALEDYIYTDTVSKDVISPKFCKALDKLIKQEHWTEENILGILNDITIYFKNKKTITITSALDMYETLTDAIDSIYDFGELDSENRIVCFEDTHGLVMSFSIFHKLTFLFRCYTNSDIIIFTIFGCFSCQTHHFLSCLSFYY